MPRKATKSAVIDPIAEAVGERLRRLRAEHGISQKSLAEAIGMKDPMSISRWENGTRKLSDKRSAQLADALGVSQAYLKC